MADLDPRAEVFWKAFRDLLSDPVLAEWSLDKYPGGEQDKQQWKKNPQYYFFKSSQVQPFKV